MSDRYLGCFVSSAGGLKNIIDRGEELNINTVMTHPAPPQRWNSTPFKDEVVEDYLERKSKGTSVKKVYFHGIYLINLANPDKQKFHLSKVSIVNHLDLLNKIDGDGVIFHTGSFKEIGEEEGFARVVKGINWVFENLTTETKGRKLFLECAAGSGNIVGDRFEELARIFEGVEDRYKENLGICLDTQHMFASGYDLINNLDGVVSEIESILGLDKITAVHFNDSKTELGSHKDRHANLGEGLIGKDAMSAFLNHRKLKNLDFILETPALDTPEGARQQIELLKKWA